MKCKHLLNYLMYPNSKGRLCGSPICP